ncbi:death-associated protein 1 [Limosa lapponica baueri]|uniref:Death-associated protein 1 n=1 Tax=Limosa lapponica baueri TaxID=1758121 RepID=A0A2I0U945_LIMLA|nr:death-associated protein 1 [Limosa lapponica baueri]
MVSTWRKVMRSTLNRMDVGTQTEVTQKYAAVQVTGCRECQDLLLVADDSCETCCIRCEQIYDLLSVVAELKEEVERLRNNREKGSKGPGAPVGTPGQAEDKSINEKSEWKQVCGRGTRKFPTLPTSSCEVPLRNRYEVLLKNGQLSEEVGKEHPITQMPPKPKKHTPQITTTPSKKK